MIIFFPTRAPELNPIEQMWNILVQRLKNVALLGPGQNHSHQAATDAAMVMNLCTLMFRLATAAQDIYLIFKVMVA